MGKKSENSLLLITEPCFLLLKIRVPRPTLPLPGTPVLCQAHRIITSYGPGTILTWVIILQTLTHCLLRV